MAMPSNLVPTLQPRLQPARMRSLGGVKPRAPPSPSMRQRGRRWSISYRNFVAIWVTYFLMHSALR